MGIQRFGPPAIATARRLRCLLVGSSVSETGLDYGRPLWTIWQAAAETGPTMGKQVCNVPLHRHGSLCREYNTRAGTHLEPAGVALQSTFSQSAAQLANQSTQDTSGGKKKSSKRASEIASQLIKTQKRPIVFECSECEAMCVTRILRDPYDRGVVIVRCMDCRSVNLISDQLNLFKSPGSMRKFLSERGVNVRNGPEKSYELTPESFAEMEQQQQQQQQASTV